MSPNAGEGRGELRGFRQGVQLCTWGLTKLWRSNSIFNLLLKRITEASIKKHIRSRDTVTYLFQIRGHAAKCGRGAGREGHQARDSQTQVQIPSKVFGIICI